jgi:hypothetical protein
LERRVGRIREAPGKSRDVGGGAIYYAIMAVLTIFPDTGKPEESICVHQRASVFIRVKFLCLRGRRVLN